MARSALRNSGRVNVLFTCIGRRVSLLNSFRQAAKELKIKATFFGTDTTDLSPALQLCDVKCLVKPISDPGHLRQLLSIVRKNDIRLLVPTIDTDLQLLADNHAKFEKLGCHVLISDPGVIEISQDKRKTSKFLARHGFDGPATMSVRTALDKKRMKWPILVKPWDGAASKGVMVVNNRRELEVFGKRIRNCIVQEFVDGVEYTCDAYVDLGGKVRCVVPRMRIETRGGEVSKGRVVKDLRVMEKVAELVTALGAGPGVITAQLMVTKSGQMKFIEINPRFGGGAPLSIKAGANFPKWIMQECTEKKPRIRFDGFKDGLTMLRYDAEVWV